MGTSRKNKNRAFFRVGESVHLAEQRIQGSRLDKLPHNSFAIPARYYSIFLFFLYTFATFLFIVMFFSVVFIPNPLLQQQEYSLVLQPRSFSHHLSYFKSLVSSYSFTDASNELYIIESAYRHKAIVGFDQPALVVEKNVLDSRNAEFRRAVSEYTYWSVTLKAHPNYRDGLYRFAQLSFLLNNSEFSRGSLQKAVTIDPFFEQGKNSLAFLQNN